MQTIINEYFLELVAAVSIIVMLLLFTLVKKSNKKTVGNLEEDIESEDEYVEINLNTQEIKPKEEIKEVEKEEIKEVETKPESKQGSTQRVKRELVHHDKITRDDFSIFKNVKILIAEDNIINQKVITSLLSSSGIYITITNDGQECLDILKDDSDFSLIFMDAHMPIIDGFQATRLIRQNPDYNHLPIVALSGETAADDIKNMMNVGMEAHLEKPLRMGPLYDILYMYTTGEEGKENSIQPNHNTSQEFDSNKGLSICGEDKEFYLEILNDFLSKYTDSAVKLQKYINDTNSADADKMLLDISGVAANIGADNLHTIALDLKDSISHPSDLEYISYLKEYKRSLTKVCEAINKYIAS